MKTYLLSVICCLTFCCSIAQINDIEATELALHRVAKRQK